MGAFLYARVGTTPTIALHAATPSLLNLPVRVHGAAGTIGRMPVKLLRNDDPKGYA